MLFRKQYDEKEVNCPSCHQKVKPLVKKNRLKDNFYGQRFTGIEKRFLLICPRCKAVISTK